MYEKEIFVSSGHFYNRDIKDVIRSFDEHGFQYIEISCGKVTASDLNILKKYTKSGFKFRLHNYFPVLGEDFVLNLASSEKSIREKSRKHLMTAVDWSNELDSDYYGFHAGFRLSPKLDELGNTFRFTDQMSSIDTAKNFFIEELHIINEYAVTNGVCLGIENNVYSMQNFEKYGLDNPFLFCGDETSEIDFIDNTSILLDVGHLRISAKSLNFDAHHAFNKMLGSVSCIHYSDNNGMSDTNCHLRDDSWFWQLDLEQVKRHTIEVYDEDLNSLHKDVDLLNRRLNNEK